MHAVTLFSAILCTTFTSAARFTKPNQYLTIIGNKLGYYEFPMNAIKSAIDTVLEDPELWTINLLKSEKETFRGTGNNVSLLRHHQQYVICEDCVERHRRSKVLQVLCQFNKWVDELEPRKNASFATVATTTEEETIMAMVVEDVMADIIPEEPYLATVAPFDMEIDVGDDEANAGAFDLVIDVDDRATENS